ncbi:CPX chromosomal region candidate gene 1 protein [Sciurus carolinensis]|uniref:CPX chromosomal region candidate gene 1 protein n=1 Tax=Sciurus carolinensis TaxID=30640 RepID=UPI001FB38341|nr:CPX chromosomal region candidate gene 1 protein [Sciurus carolinensis]
MASPTKEGSDSADNTLKMSENEAPNDCSADREPSFADPNVISQVESNLINREPSTSTSQEDAVLSTAENTELKAEKIQNDSQKEDVSENSVVIQMPIPRKLIFLTSGLGRITYLSIPVLKTDKSSSLSERPIFYPGKVEMKMSDFSHSIINCKIPLQLSIQWRIPFISNHEIRGMILRLLCGRHFSQTAGLQNSKWVKQKYIAFLPRPNVLTHGERTIIFGRPLRVYYYRSLIERMTSGKFYKSGDTKGRDGFQIFLRPGFYIPRTQIQNTSNRKVFENHLRSHHNIRVVIISIDNGWKYLCPICGCSFNNFNEFRQHSCSFPGN